MESVTTVIWALGLVFGLVTILVTSLGGIIVWLVKGKIEAAEKSIETLKQHIVYEDTCSERHKRYELAVSQLAETQAELKALQSQTFNAISGMNAEIHRLAGNIEGIKGAFEVVCRQVIKPTGTDGG